MSKSHGKPGRRVWDTMKQAAGALGCGITILKKAKASGCPAFRQSRIYEEELGPWLSEHREEIAAKRSKEDVQIEKLLEECRKLRNANDEHEKLLVKREAVVAALQKTIDKIRSFLEAKLENEYPSVVASMDVPAARLYGRTVHDQIVTELQKCRHLWNF